MDFVFVVDPDLDNTKGTNQVSCNQNYPARCGFLHCEFYIVIVFMFMVRFAENLS
jgi:hypothetical protein